MTLTKELLQKAMINQGFKSLYELSSVTGIEKTKMYAWNAELSEANAEMTLILMKLGNVSVDDALLKVTQSPAKRELASKLKSLNCILCKIKSQLWRFVDNRVIHSTIC